MLHFLKILAAPDAKRVGEKIALEEGNVLLGRSNPPAAIVFDGPKVSRRHCQIVVRGADVRIDDLHSNNGVFVNGAKVESSILKSGDRVVIGDFIVEVVARKA